MKSIKLNSKFFYIIPILLVIYFILRWRFTPTSSPDTNTYINMAEVFPYISEAKYKSVFPVGYPIFLKILNLVFNKYAVSYKIGTFLCLIFSLAFVKIKDFYWREIWTLLTFHTFLSIMPWGWSETLIIPLLIMVFYYNYQFLNNKISSKKFVLLYPILLFSCVLVKYSSLFFIVAHFLFTIFLKLSKDKKYWDYLKISTISSLISGLYLLYNKIITGFAMGERSAPTEKHLQIYYSFNSIFSEFAPFPFLSLDWIFSPILGGIFAIFFIKIIYRYFLKNINLVQYNTEGGGYNILIFNILNSTLFLSATIYSYFTTTIDPLGSRLLLGFYIFFFFAVIIALPKFKNKNILLLSIAIFCSSIQIIDLIVTYFTKIKGYILYLLS